MTRQRERPLELDMNADDAFERFLRVDPSELPEGTALKQKRGPPKRPPSAEKKAKPSD